MSRPVIEITHRVEFHETDMAGIVHFSNFFRYMEKCEHALARQLDPEDRYLSLESGSLWPRVHASCDFQQPARFGDLITIQQFVTRLGRSAIGYEFRLFGPDQQPLAIGKIILAHVRSEQGKLIPSPIPPAIRDALAPFLAAPE